MTEQSSPVVNDAVANAAFNMEATGFAAPTNTPTVGAQFTGKLYTEDELNAERAKITEREKNKLYPQIDSLKNEVDVLKKDREERLAEAERARLAAEEDARKKAEAELSTRELLDLKEKEWAAQLEEIRQENARNKALAEREREFSELSQYRAQRIQEVQDDIMPELLDEVTGNTREEIEASIAKYSEKTARILAQAQSGLVESRKDMIGTRTTLPPTMENNSGQQKYSAEQISAMSVTEYAKIRDSLGLGQTSNKGIFG